jgi:hypothetical protein
LQESIKFAIKKFKFRICQLVGVAPIDSHKRPFLKSFKSYEANAMTVQTSQVIPDQDQPSVKPIQDGTELYDSHTPDSYDAHIIPAEVAARKKHEGDNFKHLAEHPKGADSIDTVSGFTVDKEGLVDNFGIEPEMYYEKPGDVSDTKKQ